MSWWYGVVSLSFSLLFSLPGASRRNLVDAFSSKGQSRQKDPFLSFSKCRFRNAKVCAAVVRARGSPPCRRDSHLLPSARGLWRSDCPFYSQSPASRLHFGSAGLGRALRALCEALYYLFVLDSTPVFSARTLQRTAIEHAHKYSPPPIPSLSPPFLSHHLCTELSLFLSVQGWFRGLTIDVPCAGPSCILCAVRTL